MYIYGLRGPFMAQFYMRVPPKSQISAILPNIFNHIFSREGPRSKILYAKESLDSPLSE